MRLLHILGCLLLVLISTSCEDTFIDPFSNDGQYFTIYGYLDNLDRNHEVRVIPVTRRPTKITDPNDPESQLDARVRSINLLSGETKEWSHSLEQLEDGTYGHIFRASFLTTDGATYRLEVERSDGIITYAETTMPNIPEAFLFENGPYQFNADSSVIFQDIHIPKISSPWNIQALYVWEAGQAGPGTDNTRIFVPYDRQGERTEDGGWDIRIQISEDQAYVRENIKEIFEGIEIQGLPITLNSMGVQLRVLDKNWDPPAGIFDPEILANPNTLTNVVNGYGFWGAVGLYRQEWCVFELSGVLGYAYSDRSC